MRREAADRDGAEASVRAEAGGCAATCGPGAQLGANAAAGLYAAVHDGAVVRTHPRGGVGGPQVGALRRVGATGRAREHDRV
ncbi:MAG: hypothetical protein RL846_44315, partial [Deltaproteobacteria bacterium]